MRQRTLAEEGFEKYRKPTRREQFLDDHALLDGRLELVVDDVEFVERTFHGSLTESSLSLSWLAVSAENGDSSAAPA